MTHPLTGFDWSVRLRMSFVENMAGDIQILILMCRSFTEINKVRVNLFQVNSVPKDPMVLPEVQGMAVTLTEKVYVPVDEYPDVSEAR